MLTRVDLENFRGLKRTTFSVDAITALIGRNSAGKSSVLHGLRIVCDVISHVVNVVGVAPRLHDQEIILCRDLNLPDVSIIHPLASWKLLFSDADPGDGSEARVTLHFSPGDSLQRASVRLACGRNEQLKVTATIVSVSARRGLSQRQRQSREFSDQLRRQVREVLPLMLFLPAFYGVTPREEYRTRPLVNRMLGSGDQSHIVRNLIARLDAGAIDRLNGYLQRTLGARIVSHTKQQDAERYAELRVTYQDTNGALELSSAGAGLVGLTALFSALEGLRPARATSADRPVVVLLDEPEAHLHPRLQGEVANVLSAMAREFGAQLFIATHSVEMIREVWGLPGAVVIGIERGGTPRAFRAHDELMEGLGEFCDLTPFAALNFLSSRRVLFCEGPSDFEILDVCAKALYRSDPVRARRWASYTRIPLDGVSRAPAPDLLARVLTPSLFPSLTDRDPVRVGIAIDRDLSREPMKILRERSEHTPHLEFSRVVWSEHSIENFFLHERCLCTWLAARTGRSEDALREAVRATLAAADNDHTLNDPAIDGRRAIHRRPDSQGRMFSEDEAMRRAREEVRASPATWQPGHLRERFVLQRLRAALDVSQLPGNVRTLLVGADHNKLDLDAAIPRELRELLDALTEP